MRAVLQAAFILQVCLLHKCDLPPTTSDCAHLSSHFTVREWGLSDIRSIVDVAEENVCNDNFGFQQKLSHCGNAEEMLALNGNF